MSKFIKDLSLFVAGLSLLTGRSAASVPAPQSVTAPSEPTAVPLRPLNFERDNLFASHRSHSSHSSHSSHRSHSSHYSGSGGTGYDSPSPPPAPLPFYAPAPPAPALSTTSPVAPRPAPSLPPAAAASSSSTNRNSLTAPHPAPAAQTAAPTGAVELSLDQKRRLQIMRVQIALTSLGLYRGRVDGQLNGETREALQRFQDLKGLPQTGMMSTPTLNALGVPAVN